MKTNNIIESLAYILAVILFVVGCYIGNPDQAVTPDPNPEEFGTGHATAYTETYRYDGVSPGPMGAYQIYGWIQNHEKKFGLDQGKAFRSDIKYIY